MQALEPMWCDTHHQACALCRRKRRVKCSCVHGSSSFVLLFFFKKKKNFQFPLHHLGCCLLLFLQVMVGCSCLRLQFCCSPHLHLCSGCSLLLLPPADSTPTHKTRLCSTVCSQACTAQLMRMAQELHCHLCV